VLLGDGVRLFDGLEVRPDVKLVRVVHSPRATHLKYRLVKG
jgi:hypothetical protein